MKCQNCGAVLTCGCKRRTASNGKICCAKCIVAYENSLKNSTPVKATTEPVITNIVYKRT
jgi:hypothetical protein